MDLKLIRNLVRIMERGEVSELEIDDEKAGLRVHLKRGQEAQSSAGPVVNLLGGAATPALAVAAQAVAGLGADEDEDTALEGVTEITSPMVGTFYRATSPTADPFASEGTHVDEDSVVCIIEAMKVMNEIKAECTGDIVEILVENGEPVEFGQPLFLIKTS
jgi:acetyl-CoA carboxylase biotin carboxyl carrier protein